MVFADGRGGVSTRLVLMAGIIPVIWQFLNILKAKANTWLVGDLMVIWMVCLGQIQPFFMLSMGLTIKYFGLDGFMGALQEEK